MTSKITIEFDFDSNCPFIKCRVDNSSQDVRDQIVRQFIQTFAYESSWAKIGFTGSGFTIYPIKPEQLEEESRKMNDQVATRKTTK